MKKELTWATSVAALVLVFVAGYSIQAQQPNQASASAAANVKRYKIGVVDLSRIFTNHAGFKASMEKVKQEVAQVEAGIREDQKKLRGMVEQLKTLKPGTPDFKRLDEQLSQNRAGMQLKMEKHRKEFMEKEAQIFNQTYQAVSGAVKQYSHYNDLALVVQFRSDPTGSDQAGLTNSVMKQMNNPIVFQNRIDITDDILTMLNTPSTARAHGTQPPPQ